MAISSIILRFHVISILSPLFMALHTPVKYCHRFIRRPCLHLFEKGSSTITICTCSTCINICLLYILPCRFATQHIVNLFTIKFHLNDHFFFDQVNVRTCFAVKSVVVYCFFYKKDVAASWAKYHTVYFSENKKMKILI